MKRFILILGGARSGKSAYAVDMAKRLSCSVVFIATAASPADEEMKERIRLHRASRPREWELIEEGKDVSGILPGLQGRYRLVLLDCIGLLISNLLAENMEDREIGKRIEKLVDTISKVELDVILVSNETGCGIVPDNPLARRFRDLLGRANQMIAGYADEVIFMQSGIPLMIKGGQRDADIEGNDRWNRGGRPFPGRQDSEKTR